MKKLILAITVCHVIDLGHCAWKGHCVGCEDDEKDPVLCEERAKSKDDNCEKWSIPSEYQQRLKELGHQKIGPEKMDIHENDLLLRPGFCKGCYGIFVDKLNCDLQAKKEKDPKYEGHRLGCSGWVDTEETDQRNVMRYIIGDKFIAQEQICPPRKKFDPKNDIHPMEPGHCMMTSAYMIVQNALGKQGVMDWNKGVWNKEVTEMDNEAERKPGDWNAYRHTAGFTEGAFSENYIAFKLEQLDLYFEVNPNPKLVPDHDGGYRKLPYMWLGRMNKEKTWDFWRNDIIGEMEGISSKDKDPIVGILMGVSTDKTGDMNHGTAFFYDKVGHHFYYIDTNEHKVEPTPTGKWPGAMKDEDSIFGLNMYKEEKLEEKQLKKWFPMTYVYKLNMRKKFASIKNHFKEETPYYVEKSMDLGTDQDIDKVTAWLRYKCIRLDEERGGAAFWFIIRKKRKHATKQKAKEMNGDYYEYYDFGDYDDYKDVSVYQEAKRQQYELHLIFMISFIFVILCGFIGWLIGFGFGCIGGNIIQASLTKNHHDEASVINVSYV